MPQRLLVLLTALLLWCPPAAAAPVPDEPARSERCNAMEVIVRDGAAVGVREYAPIGAITHPRRFGANAALWVSVHGLGCDEFRGVLMSVLPAADEGVALDALAGGSTASTRWRSMRVIGVLARENQTKPRRVCFNGYITRRMRCGRIKGFSDFVGKPAICVDVKSEHATRFAPIQDVLGTFGAELPLGSFVM